MSATLGHLEPALLWERFAELTRIPRPSKAEDEARAHVLAWAAARSLAAEVDAGGNVVVRVPASAGREAAPAVVLQAHLDMVCERDPESPNDPRAGRIEVVHDGDWVAASGTTLGADNGIGVAAALAAAEDAGLEHGPLELLLTVSEEDGLDGAKALDPALVTGRVLLNLDGTSDGALVVGCAGSIHTATRLSLRHDALPDGHEVLAVRVSGVRGGHSGGDIAAGRINAIKALARMLSRAHEAAPFRLAAFEGGVSRNAIPRDARALVALPSGDANALRAAAGAELAALRDQHAKTDAGVRLDVDPNAGSAPADEAASEEDTARALDLVAAIPSGVVALGQDVPGSVETSTSLNVARTEGHTLELLSMTRSANAPALADVVAGIRAAARLAGASVEVQPSYPPWRPDLDSQLLRTARRTYERLFGAEPMLTVVHGGLECAVIGGKLPGVEMVSLGPTIEGPHAPGERVGVASTQRFYRLLAGLLDDLSR